MGGRVAILDRTIQKVNSQQVTLSRDPDGVRE